MDQIKRAFFYFLLACLFILPRRSDAFPPKTGSEDSDGESLIEQWGRPLMTCSIYGKPGISCSPDECIELHLGCNGFFDCENGADEEGCDDGLDSINTDKESNLPKILDSKSCSIFGKSAFPCDDGSCIELHLRCNNEKNCPNNDDEFGCDEKSEPEESEPEKSVPEKSEPEKSEAEESEPEESEPEESEPEESEPKKFEPNEVLEKDTDDNIVVPRWQAITVPIVCVLAGMLGVCVVIILIFGYPRLWNSCKRKITYSIFYGRITQV